MDDVFFGNEKGSVRAESETIGRTLPFDWRFSDKETPSSTGGQ